MIDDINKEFQEALEWADGLKRDEQNVISVLKKHSDLCDSSVSVLYAGKHDVDRAYSPHSGKCDKRKVRVICPACSNLASPLCSKKTVQLNTKWCWVGDLYRAPHVDYETVCRKCNTLYRFTTYRSQ